MRGLRWVALTRVVSEGFSLVAAVVLARLIAPAAFGHAAVALIFLPLAVILTFEGFASALVQRSTIDENDRRSAMFMSLVGGAALSILVFALAGPVWRPLFGAQTASLIELMSPTMFIGALGGVSLATLLRALDFRSTSLIEAASVVAGSAVAIALAAAGLGARAIVIGALVQVGASSALLIVVSRPPLPRWSWQAQRRIMSFGLPAALAGLVEILFRNIDYAILAARVSAAETGFYYRAFNLGVVYQQKLSGVMVQVAYPLYSRTSDPERLRAIHERAARVHAAIVFPLQALLVVLAPVLVPFVFGSAWAPAVHPTQILAIAGMFAAVLAGYAQVMLAIGKPRPLLTFNVARIALYGGAVLLASRHGLVTVALAVVAAYLVILLGAYRLMLQRYAGISIARLAPELGPAVVGCIAMSVVTVPLTHILNDNVPRALEIALVGSAGLCVYAAVLRVVFPSAWTDARTLVMQVLGPLGRRLRGPAHPDPGDAVADPDVGPADAVAVADAAEASTG
ncbi:MAG: oligosaccharide flippase family protein [Solirubrobacteraceae bacterium]